MVVAAPCYWGCRSLTWGLVRVEGGNRWTQIKCKIAGELLAWEKIHFATRQWQRDPEMAQK